MKTPLTRFLFVFATVLSISCFANQKITNEEKTKVEEYFQNSIGAGLKAGDVEVNESNIKGLVEIYVQGKLMYFDIESQLLFIGEIYDKNGASLTKATLKQKSLDRLSTLPKVHIVLNGGKGLKKVVEFTDPDCPYCRKASAFFAEHNNAVERHIYFDTRIHPAAKSKVIHILCAKDREKAFHAVYTNQLTKYEYCEKGEALAEQHQQASIEMAVSATPTFFIGDNLVRGFDRQKLADYLRSN
jgi:thiol:disulfide interchange protein DsbC